MLIDRIKTYILIIASVSASACSSMSPAHYGRFTFEGTVKDQNGKPVPHAWVKVRGWETLSDLDGKWTQVQVVHCGTIADHVESYEENDEILVTADGFGSKEEKFVVKHPGYFQSCTAEQTIHFDSVLVAVGTETLETKVPARQKMAPSERPAAPKSTKGSYSL